MKKLLVSIINFYQIFLSFDSGILRILAPGGVCRYEISCSQFTKEAILKYGVWKGVGIGFKRLLACNPFSK